MQLSIVIVNWNSRDDLAACLESLRAEGSEDFEVIVVDNGSQDGSVELLRERYPEVTLLAQPTNLGFAEACNLGIAASTGEWAVMLNNDTVVEPGFIEALKQSATTAPRDCGMLQCLMLFMNRPEVTNSTGIVLRGDGGGSDRGAGRRRTTWTSTEDIFCPTAGAAAYRRTMLEEVRLGQGYFDRSHFCYLEDLDLGWRARLAGWSAQLVPGAVVHHRYHGSSDRHGRAWHTVISKTNRTRTLVKNASWPFLLRVGPVLAANWLAIWRAGGVTAVRRLPEVLGQAWASRAEVTRMARVGRRTTERAWVKR